MKMLLMLVLSLSTVSVPAWASVPDILERINHRYPPAKLKYDWDGAVMLWGLGRLGLAQERWGTPMKALLAGYYQEFSRQDPMVSSPDLAAPALGAALLKQLGGIEGQPIIDKARTFILREPRNSLGTLNHVGHYHRFKPWLPLTRRFVAPSIWGDSMVMYVLNGHFIAGSEGDPELAEFIQAQPQKFIDHLQHQDGLFRHAYWLRSGKLYPYNGSWLRGHGWVMAALAELMEDGVPGLEAAFQRAADASLTYQNDQGMWHTIIEGRGKEETSGTALMVYALAKGERLGVLGSNHAQAARRGWQALQAKLVERKVGKGLKGCSGYTNAMAYASMYVSPIVKSDRETPFCLGAYLLAASEMEP
jgi:rhamnogalacturonyl hydrolase YesR